jgi:hypothetical protein
LYFKYQIQNINLADPIMIGAAIAGMVIALVWRGIIPYLLKRKEAEENGQKAPSFSTTYMTSFLISIVGGIVAIMLVGDQFDAQVENAKGVFGAMAIGGTFTYTILSGFNSLIDLKSNKIALETKVDPAAAKDAEINRPS